MPHLDLHGYDLFAIALWLRGRSQDVLLPYAGVRPLAGCP